MKSIFLTIIICILSVQITSAQWVLMNNGIGNADVRALVYSGNNIFAGVIGSGGGVYLSTNNGSSWNQTTLSNQSVYSLVVNGNNIFAGTINNGVFISDDNGTTWTQTLLNNQTIYKLAANGNNIFAGTYNPNNGLFLSTDNGLSWVQTALNNQHITSLTQDGNNIFAGSGTGNGVYQSSNNGATWTQTSFTQSAYALAISGNNIFVGTLLSQGVYKSTNNGSSWVQTALNNQNVYSLSMIANYIFAGTSANGVYVSIDNGSSWTQRSDGLPTGATVVRTIIVTNNNIFAGLGFNGINGVYRRPLSEIITGIQPISNEIPGKFSLSQNYPNPFNPVTKINFNIAKTGFVSLSIFDALGREVETLVNQQMNAGSYGIDFNGSKIVSGVYFYRLQSADFTDVKKLVLLK
jgi:photosystem II stability/assembly factor-like uncharacterized protein